MSEDTVLEKKFLRITSIRNSSNAFQMKLKENDIIYFDKSSSHRIEINKEPYHVIRQENVVVVL